MTFNLTSMEMFGIMSKEVFKYKRVLGLPWQKIEEEVLVLQPKKKMAHEMNQVASDLWFNLEEAKTLEELTDSLCSDYEVERETVRKDVEQVLSELQEKEMIEVL